MADASDGEQSVHSSDPSVPDAAAAGDAAVLVPRPPAGEGPPRVALWKVAMCRLGIEPAELQPTTVAALRAQGLTQESAERKFTLKEQCRLKLTGRVEQETARLQLEEARLKAVRSDRVRANSRRSRTGVARAPQASEGGSTDSDRASGDFNGEQDCDGSGGGVAGGGGGGRGGKSSAGYDAAVHTLLHGSDQLTLTAIAKERMRVSRENISHKLRISIARKTAELRREEESRELERQRVEQDRTFREEVRRRRDAHDAKRADTYVAEQERLQAMHARREQMQREKERRTVDRDQRRDENRARRRRFLTQKASVAYLSATESTAVNLHNKAKQCRVVAQRERRARRKFDAEFEKGEAAAARRVEEARSATQTHAERAEKTQRQGSALAAWRDRMLRLRREEKEEKSQRWRAAFVSASGQLERAFVAANEHRADVRARGEDIEATRRGNQEVLNTVTEEFAKEHMKYVKALEERRLDAIAHTNEEKRSKAQRAQRAKSYNEDQLRRKTEARLEQYGAMVEDLGRCWQKITQYGKQVRVAESRIRTASESGAVKQQIRRLRQILASNTDVTPPASPPRAITM